MSEEAQLGSPVRGDGKAEAVRISLIPDLVKAELTVFADRSHVQGRVSTGCH